MSRPGLVYLVTNTVNQKRYIGITTRTLYHRKCQHVCDARSGRGYRLHAAIRKYGEQAFTFEVIAELSDTDQLAAEEMRLIADLKPEYNVTPGGDGNRAPRSAETLRRMSEAGKRRVETHGASFEGKKHTAESRARMSAALTGKPGPWKGKKRPDMVEGARARQIVNPVRYWLGKTRPDETKAKISATKTGTPNPIRSEADAATRRANCLLGALVQRKRILNLRDGLTFDSMSAAATFYGLDKGAVSAVARGKRTSVFGHRFQYCEAEVGN